MLDYLPMAITERSMDLLEKSGKAEVLLKPAAEDEFGKVFHATRCNQLVSKVTMVKYYRHTQLGYQEIKPEEMEERLL